MTNDGVLGIAVLGSTGSIGTQTLEVIAAHAERFEAVSLAAGHNRRLLEQQAQRFRPKLVALDDGGDAPNCGAAVFLPGLEGLIACAVDDAVDIVVVATSGIAALPAVVAAIEAGKVVALANKESLVCAADVILPLVERCDADIRPVDSEHSAIWQCLGSRSRRDLRSLTITASGGPFRTWEVARMGTITPADALAHPTWSMGGKITVDSATLVNKGLEVIEAHHLFRVAYDDIEVVVHPQSIVHSLVEFRDGSTLAQLSSPDMRVPIQFALSWPEHIDLGTTRLSLTDLGHLDFEPPDLGRFPALRLCIEAGRRGGSYPAVLSAVDEVAVSAFLGGRLSFHGIAETIDHVLARHDPAPILGLDDVQAVDSWARRAADDAIARQGG